jgi:hypothetical protein
MVAWAEFLSRLGYHFMQVFPHSLDVFTGVITISKEFSSLKYSKFAYTYIISIGDCLLHLRSPLWVKKQHLFAF